MVYRLLTYPNKSKGTPTFYIQMKGEHSGRPLKQPIKNCVAVYSDVPFLFELVYLLFKGRKFEIHLKGSVIPFVRIEDLNEVINEGLKMYSPAKEKLLVQIKKIDEAVNLYQKQKELLLMAQKAICNEFLR